MRRAPRRRRLRAHTALRSYRDLSLNHRPITALEPLGRRVAVSPSGIRSVRTSGSALRRRTSILHSTTSSSVISSSSSALRPSINSSPAIEMFQDLGIIEPILRAVRDLGYDRPTPIQQRAIPLALAGRDILGLRSNRHRQDGRVRDPHPAAAPRQAEPSGRRPIRALVLSPTRELAAQIGESFADYGRGLGATQHRDVRRRRLWRASAELCAAASTSSSPRPGACSICSSNARFTWARSRPSCSTKPTACSTWAFSRRFARVIAALPQKRQTLFFSATMPQDIRDAGRTACSRSRASRGRRRSHDGRDDRSAGLLRRAHGTSRTAAAQAAARPRSSTRALVFTRTKHGANRVVEHLEKAGVGAEAIHGNKSQRRARARARRTSRAAKCACSSPPTSPRAASTSTASRTSSTSTCPNVPENYVHRIGRTAAPAL